MKQHQESILAHLVMEAVSAHEHTDVIWTHVLVTDDARILDIQLQSQTHTDSQVQTGDGLLEGFCWS